MKPWHWILVGIAVAAALIGSGFVLGRNHIKCPDRQAEIDSLSTEYAILQSIANDAEKDRQAAQWIIDSIEANTIPAKTQVHATSRILYRASLDSILGVFRANNVE